MCLFIGVLKSIIYLYTLLLLFSCKVTFLPNTYPLSNTFFSHGRWWWWLALSVPAVWREQGHSHQPSSYHHHQQRHSTKIVHSHGTAASFLNDYRSTPTSKDYCDLFDRISEAPSLYTCRICGKTVSNRWHHAAIHRPQSNLCPLCRQSFTRRDNMKAHIRLKHGAIVAEVLGDTRFDRDIKYMWKVCDKNSETVRF